MRFASREILNKTLAPFGIDQYWHKKKTFVMERRISSCDSCVKAGRSVRAIYRCPACAVMSCSLPCVKKHKEETVSSSSLADLTLF